MRGFHSIAVAVLAIIFVKLLSPLNAMDTAWDFGHAYSALRSDTGILYNHYLHNTPDYLYGLVITPLASISYSTYTPKVFYSILLILFSVLLYVRQFKNDVLSIGIILLLISNYIVLTHRPEIFTLLMGYLIYPYTFNGNQINWKIAIPAGLVLFLIHPANAILMGAAVLASKNLLLRKKTIYLITYILVIGLLMYVVMSTNQIHHFSILKNRILNGNPLSDILQFLKYSGLTLFALFIAKRSMWTKTFALNYSILVLLCLLLGAYYYYIFLAVPFILLGTISRDRITKYIVATAIIFNIYANVLHPSAVHFENRDYNAHAAKIINTVKDRAISTSLNNIFINQYIGFPLYANSKATKMIMKTGVNNYFVVKEPKDGDVAYFTNRKDADNFSNSINQSTTAYNTTTHELLKPVKGKLTLQSLYTKRTDSLGLYEMTIKQIWK